MPRTTLKIVAASAVAAGALVAGGAAMALADDSTSTSTSTSTSSPGPSASASPGTGDPAGKRGGSHAEVTGTEADKVIAAVTAKDSTVTVETVRKDEDGSYDALGTKDGAKVSFDVSADLATVTERTGGGPGGHGRPGGPGGHGRGGDSDAGTSTTPSDANTSTSADATAPAA